MVKKSRKNKKKQPGWRVALHYLFLWPTIRFYYALIRGYFRKKKAHARERVIIIQER